MKKWIFWIVLAGLAAYSEYVYFNLPIDRANNQPFQVIQPSRTGVITSDFTELQNVKHGTRTDYYFEIEYSTGREIHEVTGKMFYSFRPGEHITLHETKSLSCWLIPIAVLNLISMILVPIALVILLIIWVFAPQHLKH